MPRGKQSFIEGLYYLLLHSVALLNDTFFKTKFCMIVMITLAGSNESDDLDSESEDHEIVNCCIQLIITVSNIRIQHD